MVEGLSVYPVSDVFGLLRAPARTKADPAGCTRRVRQRRGPNAAGLRRRARTGTGKARARNRRERRPQRAADRRTGLRQKHARKAPALHSARDAARGKAGDDGDLFCRRPASGRRVARRKPPVPRAAPHDFRPRPFGRRIAAAPRRDLPRAQRRPFSRRAAGVFPQCDGNAAPAARGRHCHRLPRQRHRGLPLRLHARRRDEPLPLRVLRAPDAPLHLLGRRGRPLSRPRFRPLLDRIDLHIEVPPVDFDSLTSAQKEESSAQIKVRVDAARAVQARRFQGSSVTCNAQIPPERLREVCRTEPAADVLIKTAFERFGLPPAPTTACSRLRARSPIWTAPNVSKPGTPPRPCATARSTENTGQSRKHTPFYGSKHSSPTLPLAPPQRHLHSALRLKSEHMDKASRLPPGRPASSRCTATKEKRPIRRRIKRFSLFYRMDFLTNRSAHRSHRYSPCSFRCSAMLRCNSRRRKSFASASRL